MTSIDLIRQDNFSPEENNSQQKYFKEADANQKLTLVKDLSILFLILTSCGWFIFYLYEPTTLPIKQVSIEGKFNHLSTLHLKEIIQDKVKGNFFNIDVELIRNYIVREPWVKDVSVQRVWPREIRLIVREQSAVANWNDKALLNDMGEKFIPDDLIHLENLPGLHGPEGTEQTVLEKYRELDELLAPINISIDHLVLSERRAWHMIVNNDIRINIGRLFIEQRIERLVNLFQEGLDGKLDNIEYVDMRYANGFVIRWKKQIKDLQADKDWPND